MNEGQLNKELSELNNLILSMSSLVERVIHDSLIAFGKGDLNLAKSIVINDKEIDEMELKINEKCLTLLALYQPVASDLRFITTAIAIVTDLERIGDLASNIAQRVVEIGERSVFKSLTDIPQTVEIAEAMLHKSLDAFIKRDTKEATDVTKMKVNADKIINTFYMEVKMFLNQNPNNINRGLSLILISHHLERIIGHVTNIAEDVVYMVDAEVIKHKVV